MILSQSRPAGTKVNTSVPLTVTVSKKPEVVETPTPSLTPDKEEETPSSPESTAPIE